MEHISAQGMEEGGEGYSSKFFVAGVRLDSPNCDPNSNQTVDKFRYPFSDPQVFKIQSTISVKSILVL